MTSTALVSLVGIALTAGIAHADIDSLNPNALDLSVIDYPVAPTPRSLELSFAGGYAQGVGGAGSEGSVEDLSGPGGSLEAQLGLRLSPRLSIGAYGTLARFRRGDLMADGNESWGATLGIQAIIHARPARSVDPWLGLGTGVRGLWLTAPDAPSNRAYGLELARLQLGVDFRISSAIAISPVIGASASLWLAEDTPATEGLTSVSDNRLNLYVFTGLAGRFDVRL